MGAPATSVGAAGGDCGTAGAGGGVIGFAIMLLLGWSCHQKYPPMPVTERTVSTPMAMAKPLRPSCFSGCFAAKRFCAAAFTGESSAPCEARRGISTVAAGRGRENDSAAGAGGGTGGARGSAFVVAIEAGGTMRAAAAASSRNRASSSSRCDASDIGSSVTGSAKVAGAPSALAGAVAAAAMGSSAKPLKPMPSGLPSAPLSPPWRFASSAFFSASISRLIGSRLLLEPLSFRRQRVFW
jgi:hypothetical protein